MPVWVNEEDKQSLYGDLAVLTLESPACRTLEAREIKALEKRIRLEIPGTSSGSHESICERKTVCNA